MTLTLWESVEVDGRQVYLGVAERNFLFTLARRPGTLIPKAQLIEAGPGTFVAAAVCRRRLGQRLACGGRGGEREDERGRGGVAIIGRACVMGV